MVNIGDLVHWTSTAGIDYQGAVTGVGNGTTSPTGDPLVTVHTASGCQHARASKLLAVDQTAVDDRLW